MPPDPVVDPGTPPGNPPPGTPLGPQDWRPEEFRTEKSLESYKPGDGEQLVPVPKSLIKSHVEAQKMIGGSVRIPKEDAKPEEWNAFYSKLGRPEKPEDYSLKVPPDLSEGLSINQEMLTGFMKTAHEAGLNKVQAERFFNWYNTFQMNSAQTTQAEMEKGIVKLQQEWGENNFEGRLELARRAVREQGGDELVKLLDSTGLGNQPSMIKFAEKIGKLMVRHGLIVGDGAGGAMSEGGMKAKIAAIRADKEDPYNIPDHPKHQLRVDEVMGMYESLYPTKKD